MRPSLHDKRSRASLGVAEFWSGDRMIVVLGAHALAEDLAEANRLLALY